MTTQRAGSKRSSSSIQLRKVVDDDLPVFFQHQSDPTARRMAAFTAQDPTDMDAFRKRWGNIVADGAVTVRTILLEGRAIGHIAGFDQAGQREVTYWLGREFWGMGLATRALSEFLQIERQRPLFARAAKDNIASIRVLQKCGFEIRGHDVGFAHGRGEDVEEHILRLD